jgi:ribosome biogenesis protein BRX1
MIEIGPRFVLEPIKIFKGFMGGKTIYSNPLYVSANEIKREK